MSARERFEEWCGLTITDPAKAPKATALKNAYWNAWNAAWQAREAECEGLRSKFRQILREWEAVNEDKCTDPDAHACCLLECLERIEVLAESALSGKREEK